MLRFILRYRFILKVLATAIPVMGIVAAGIWNFYLFKLFGDGTENVIVNLKTEKQKLDTKTELVAIEVSVKNIGKVPVTAGQNPVYSGEGLELTVIEFNSELVNSKSFIDWDTGLDCSSDRSENNKCLFTLYKYNILGEYTAYKNSSYTINAGSEIYERMVIKVKPNKLYGVRARFFSPQNWTGADIIYFTTGD